MNILSIQSWVACGHVGNAAAILPLQRLGHEAWAIHTVQFSNHPGYGGMRGEVFEADRVAELIRGIGERGWFAQCDAILSGYLGAADTGDVVLDAVARARAANPRVLFCCDPVMGDDRPGLFVRPGIPEFFASRAIPAADVVTPNRFELGHLTGGQVETLGDAVRRSKMLLDQGPKLAAVTGLTPPIVAWGSVGTLAMTPDGAWLVTTPELPFDVAPHGTGDTFAALFLGRLLTGTSPADALSLSVSGLFEVLRQASILRMREMPLVAAQDALIHPPLVFAAEPLAL